MSRNVFFVVLLLCSLKATSSDMKHNSEREHYVVNGSDLSLSCGVVSDKDSLGLEQPVVWRWSHQDDINVRVLSVGKMLVRRDGKVRVMSRDTLELLEVTSEDVGVYQCLVDNGGQPVIENHTVILAEAPKISWCNISVTVVAGETATLHCHVSGKPWPRVLWAKSDGTKPYLEPRQNNLFLLKDAEVRDSGLYSCIASNNIGQKTVCNTSLIVIADPPVVRVQEMWTLARS